MFTVICFMLDSKAVETTPKESSICFCLSYKGLIAISEVAKSSRRMAQATTFAH